MTFVKYFVRIYSDGITIRDFLCMISVLFPSPLLANDLINRVESIYAYMYVYIYIYRVYREGE